MSYVFVEAGQCGNQLGYNMLSHTFSQLNKYSHDDQIDAFFRPSRRHGYYARCVSLDTEPKVVNDCLERARQHGQWGFDKKSIAYRHGGAGNNWVSECNLYA